MKLPKTAKEVSRLLDSGYPGYGGVGGQILRWRPYICPFEEVLQRIPRAETMLDMGCGVGAISVLAADLGLVQKVHGVETDDRAVELARKYAKPRAGEVKFEMMSAGVWPEATYDVVAAVDVLHHVKPADQRQFIHQMAGAVKMGGRLIYKDISPNPAWKAGMNRIHDVLMANQWVNYQPERVVEKWLKEEGLLIKENVRLDRLWYSHYLLVADKQ